MASACVDIMSPLSKRKLGTTAVDFGLIEGGTEKIVTDPTLVKPVTYKKPWKKCWVRKLEKTFLMHSEEGDRFMLSAVRVGHDFYISQYEDFPEMYKEGATFSEQLAHGKFCAVLRRVPNQTSFRLYSLACENCDDRLGRYTCDAFEGLIPDGKTIKPELPSSRTCGAERQVLLELSQSVLFLERAGVNARCMTVNLPWVQKDGSRAVWCPRCPKGSLSGHSPAPPRALFDWVATGGAPPTRRADVENSENAAPTTGYTSGKACTGAGAASSEAYGMMEPPLSLPHRRPSAATYTRPSTDDPSTSGRDTVTLTNRLPKWSDDIGSLTMKFLGSRVAESSSKNFLFESDVTSRPVIQFGKLSPATFSLDYKFPMSPLQAFGMFLSANAWTIKNP